MADSTDIDSLILKRAFEAKSVSKQPADTPWIRSRADLRIPIRASANGAKTSEKMQADRKTDRWADNHDKKKVGFKGGKTFLINK